MALPERADVGWQESEAVDLQPSTDESSLDLLAGGVFVGRERELRLLRAACDAAFTGQAGVVMLAGEPGIGKTRLAEETATYARRHGAQVLWGHCYEWEGASAFWPWVQIIRGYAHERDLQQVRSDLGSGAADIAQVVSEVRERFPELPSLPRMEVEEARFRLFESVATFLRNAAARQPLLLVLDDLHWAETPSLKLLQVVADDLDRTRLLIVGTYRDVEIGRRHPLTKTLTALERGHRMLRIPLRGLTSTDTARFIALSAGIEPEQALVEAVQRETEGNPFFVGEVVRLLVAEGRLGRPWGSGPWRFSLPQSVRGAVGQRLDRLSATCNEVLAAASVVGNEFALPVLARVGDWEPDAVLDALGEAIDAKLIHEDEETGRYRFVHALVQETLYAELTAARRLRLHARIGQALEQLHAANPAPHYRELAHHFTIAAPVGYAPQAVDYAVKAGERAMAQVAWETAIQQYERALHAMDLLAEPDPARRCDVLLVLGAAQYRAVPDVSEAPQGRHSYREAAEIAKAIGSPERLARAALGFAGSTAADPAEAIQQVRFLEDALALAPPGDDPLKARLLARLAVHDRAIPHLADRTATLSGEAVAMARHLGDPAVLASVLIARRVALWSPDNLDERLALITEARRMAEAAGDPYDRLWSHWWGGFDLYETGDSRGLDEAVADFAGAVRDFRAPFFVRLSALWQANRAVNEGRFADAEVDVEKLRGDSLIARYARLLVLFLLCREQGRLPEIDGLSASVVDLAGERFSPLDQHRGQIAQVLHMIALLDAGKTDEARSRFDAFAGQPLAGLPRDPFWPATIALLAEVCSRLGDRRRAALLYDLLAPYADRNVAPPDSPAYFGAVAQYLGLLATLLVRWGDATRHFEAALAMNARMRALPMLARTRVAYARMLLARRAADDRARAANLLDQAQTTADEVGMERLTEELTVLRGQATSGRASAGADAAARFGLSKRELEVLRLMADGRSNPEIADALFIGVRTVTTHVVNIHRKLGVHSRAEAVGRAYSIGLLSGANAPRTPSA